MHPETRGRFRVHNRRPSRQADEVILVEFPDDPRDPESPEDTDLYEPIRAVVPEDSDESTDIAANSVRPGHVIEATLSWENSDAYLRETTVRRRSQFYFANDITGLFRAASTLWEETRTAGDHMGATATRSTDGDPNGALYVFADPTGRNLYAELGDGRVPIEPLIDRVNGRRGVSERAVFVLQPAGGEFVVVYVVFDPEGVLAGTVRDTYDLDEHAPRSAGDQGDSDEAATDSVATLADLGIDSDEQQDFSGE